MNNSKSDLLPSFNNIVPEEITPKIKQLITENRNKLNFLLNNDSPPTWDNILRPLEDIDDKLSQLWAPISHLHSVMESEALREAYNACLPLLTEYHTDLLQNKDLFQAIQSIAKSPAYSTFNDAQRRVIDNELRDFRLAGVNLPPAAKMQFAELQKQLSKLTTQFAENLLDATHGWTFHVTDINALAGLPLQTLKMVEENAAQQGKTGWLLTLDYPCYSMAMKYLENRELRWLMYEAYVTRASDQGPHAGRWDNTSLMEDIVKTRHAIAQLLGFNNFVEYSLTTKTAKNPEEVLTFLNELVTQSKPFAEQEIVELAELAKSLDGIEQLEPWDLAFYTEKLQQRKFAFSQEDLRAYFPVDKVMRGMFDVIHKLFGLTMKERKDVDTWHPHVQFFEIYDRQQQLRGHFYTDLYARAHKREGAWMDECRVRRRLSVDEIQYPIAFLTCNFNRPLDDNKPALLTHDDVQTLFHEFGHCLHHLLTQVDYAPVSGINGVPWDTVEFPSQFFEHWCWDYDALQLISGNATTGEPLPRSLYNKLVAAKNFQSGLQMLRQLEFALFDFRLHLEFDPKKGSQVQTLIDDVRKKISVIRPAKFNRFQHSFSHIFAGGYAAGYYSYKWAEVLSSDAFSLFEEKGIFNQAVGQSFLQNILEAGGVYDPIELFINFRGRKPQISALLRHSGLIEEQDEHKNPSSS